MTKTQELFELAERCEKATGPDRELGLEVMRACGWQEVIAFGISWLRPDGKPLNRSHVPDPTTSLDAAMTLVPEGFHVAQAGECRFLTRGRFAVTVETWGVEQALDGSVIHTTPTRRHGVAETFPLALCAAALRARCELS